MKQSIECATSNHERCDGTSIPQAADDEAFKSSVTIEPCVCICHRHRINVGTPEEPVWILRQEEILQALDQQARRHFDCDAHELIRRFESGEVSRTDQRLAYVVNLFGALDL